MRPPHRRRGSRLGPRLPGRRLGRGRRRDPRGRARHAVRLRSGVARHLDLRHRRTGQQGRRLDDRPPLLRGAPDRRHRRLGRALHHLGPRPGPRRPPVAALVGPAADRRRPRLAHRHLAHRAHRHPGDGRDRCPRRLEPLARHPLPGARRRRRHPGARLRHRHRRRPLQPGGGRAQARPGRLPDDAAVRLPDPGRRPLRRRPRPGRRRRRGLRAARRRPHHHPGAARRRQPAPWSRPARSAPPAASRSARSSCRWPAPRCCSPSTRASSWSSPSSSSAAWSAVARSATTWSSASPRATSPSASSPVPRSSASA